MPMAGAAATPNANTGTTPNAASAGAATPAAGAAVGSNKTWELSDYELHRTPQEAITDGSEIAVSPRALHSELMCPICLDMLHETMTTKECLHRFCAECIITALRSGNKECPTCRKKLVSKRSLRRDPNFDMLISKIYPSRDEYEAQQQKAMARLSKSHNQLALATSIEEGMKAQSQQRKIAKPTKPSLNSQNPPVGDAAGGVTEGNVPSGNVAAAANGNLHGADPAAGPSEASASHTGGIGSNQSTAVGISAGVAPAPANGVVVTSGMAQNSLMNPPKSVSRTDSMGGDNSSNTSDEVTEVELVFKPHPDMAPSTPSAAAASSLPPEQMQTRFIKTSANASVDHLRKYLGMRLALDSETGEAEELNCTIWIAPHGNFLKIPSGLTLGTICDKYWRFNKPLEVFYCWRKASLKAISQFVNPWLCSHGRNIPHRFATLCRTISTTFTKLKTYTPRRAVMYVPGNDERKIAKIPTLGADCIVLDCEDGVATNKKEEARKNIRRILDTQSINFRNSECTVRVNSVESGLCTEDLEAILPTSNLPSSLHLPKVDSVDQLKWFIDKTSEILTRPRVPPESQIKLIIFIESARSMLALPEICKAAWDLSEKSFFVPDALVFGSDDFCADIGATRTKEARELMYARQYFVMVAKAYKLQAIDVVYIDYRDLEGLRKQALEGAQMGFTGKQIIHPGQVSVCQEAFSPSSEKIEWARELIKSFKEHQKSGKGAFNFRGSMIDMPLVLQAKNTLELAHKIDKTTIS